MSEGIAEHKGEELYVQFTASGRSSDEVPNAVEWVDRKVGDVELLGCRVGFDKLPDDVQGKIWELLDNLEFEPV